MFPVIVFTVGGEKPWEGEAHSRRNVHLTFTLCCYPPQLRAEGELQSWLSSRNFPHLYAGPKQRRETAESGKASHSSQPGLNSNKVLESTEKAPKAFLGTVQNIYSQGIGCTAAQETLLQMIKSDRQNFLNHITGKNSRSPLVLYMLPKYTVRLFLPAYSLKPYIGEEKGKRVSSPLPNEGSRQQQSIHTHLPECKESLFSVSQLPSLQN